MAIGRQAQLVGVSRSGLYYEPLVSEDDVLIMNALDEIYTACPFYGSRRMAVELGRNYDIHVCRDHVRRLMRRLGLEAIYPKKRRGSEPNDAHKNIRIFLTIYPLHPLIRSGAPTSPTSGSSKDFVTWSLSLTGLAAMWSPGSYLTRSTWISAWRTSTERSQSPRPTFTTQTKAVTSRVQATRASWRVTTSKSVWTAVVVAWTISSRNDCGARSNTKTCTSSLTPLLVRLGKD